MPHKKQANLEILKVIAMLMVVTVHYWAYGTGYWAKPVIETVDWGNAVSVINYVFIQNYLNICHSCIPFFILISGYFLSNRGWGINWKRLGLLWFYTAFYGILCCAIFYRSTPEVECGILKAVHNVLPLTGNQYWFISCYLALAVFAPFLSILSQSLSRRQFSVLLFFMLFFGTSFSKSIPWGNAVGAGNGFSLLFFSFLFMTGAYIRRFGITLNSGKKWLLLSISIALSFAFCCFKEILFHKPLMIKDPHYNDLTIFIALILFIMAKDWKVGDGFWARTLSGTTPYLFGVYLIHENIYARPHIWNMVQSQFNPQFNQGMAIPYILVIPVIVLLICIGIDFSVKWLCRITRIEDGVGWLFDRIHQWGKSLLPV